MNKARKPSTGKATPGEPKAARAKPPPVVLQVVPSLVSGGVERGAIDIAAALGAAGARTIVASAGGPMVRELERAGAVHVELPVASKNPFVMRANVGRLARLIEERGVELVHARSRASAWSARAAARRTGRPFVTTFHGAYNFGNPLKRTYNSVMAKGDRVIAISEFIAGHVEEAYKVPRARIEVIHRGVDLDIFAARKVPAARLVQLASQWRLPDGVPVVLMPGRLTRWKGQAVFLDALALLGRDDVCAVLVGPDQGRAAYRRELEALVGRHGLERVARVVGECRDMPAAFMLSDVVVSASTDPEAFGRVVAEAQAMGRPVVASDHGGARETVLEGETGWLTPPGDAPALAEAVAHALALSPTARKRLARKAVANVRENFSKDVMCARTLDLYEAVMGEAGR